MHPICFDTVAFRIHLHLWHQIVEFHVLLADLSAIFDRFNPLLEAVAGDETRIDAGLTDKCYAGLWDERSEHGSHDDGLHCWDGGVGITLDDHVSALFQVDSRIEGTVAGIHTICA
jgi:hypothetical protein